MDSILIVALVVLPGWISTTSSHLYNPRESERSALMQWGSLVYHAAVVHAFVTFLIIVFMSASPESVRETIGIEVAITDGISEYVKRSSITGYLTIFVYVIILMLLSMISGIADIPSRLVRRIGATISVINFATAPVSEVPMWYRAWELDRRSFREQHVASDSIEVGVNIVVRTKDGDVYAGNLLEYQLLSDDGNTRDIMLGDEITLWPNGDASKEVTLHLNQGRGGVMINSENISSIQYLYFEDAKE